MTAPGFWTAPAVRLPLPAPSGTLDPVAFGPPASQHNPHRTSWPCTVCGCGQAAAGACWQCGTGGVSRG
jgi:hypothetical protein